MRSALTNKLSGCPPSESITPRFLNLSAASPSSRSGLASLAITIAPRAASSRAAAIPLRATPTTSTFLPLTSISNFKSQISDLKFEISTLPQLQSGEAQQRKKNRDDQETKHQLRLHAPRDLRRIHQLEVMMYRRHPEDPPMKHLERRDLKDDRDCFDDEHAPDHHQQELLFDHHGHRAYRAPDSQRADVAHEHFRRRCVEPEKPEARPGQRRAKDRQLVSAKVVLQTEVLRQSPVAGQVSECSERRCRHCCYRYR